MAKYKTYPEYKDSGVEWIDLIPSHWKVKPTFALCEASTDKNHDGHEKNVLSLSYGNIVPRDIDTNFGLLPESFNTYQIVKSGDLILRLTDLQNDKNSLRVGLSKQKGIITSAYLKLTSKKDYINYAFLYRLLHSYDTTKVFYGMGGGLRQSMKFEDFRRLPLLQPPMCEQIKIAAFLDHETVKLDKLIEKQQQLIELLKEKRQAVISHAVTKGLNPDVPMKDSGVEWLGKIPMHWDEIKLKHITNQIIDAEHKTAEYFEDGEYLVCRTTNVKNGRLYLDGGLYTNLETYKKWIKRGKPEAGDILFTREAPAGEACVYSGDIPLCLGQRMVLFKLNLARVVPEFVLYSIYSGLSDDFVKQLSQGSTVSHFNMADIQNIPLYEPPLCEQKEIEKYLKCHLFKYDGLIASAQDMIFLMQESRTALISAAVTGKIDVRDWAIPEIKKVEEPQETTA